MDRPIVYSPAIETRVVAKFGSYYPNEISALAHSIYSVILFHQKEAKKGRASTATQAGSQRSLVGSPRR
jgi:hypothetical protein